MCFLSDSSTHGRWLHFSSLMNTFRLWSRLGTLLLGHEAVPGSPGCVFDFLVFQTASPDILLQKILCILQISFRENEVNYTFYITLWLTRICACIGMAIPAEVIPPSPTLLRRILMRRAFIHHYPSWKCPPICHHHGLPQSCASCLGHLGGLVHMETREHNLH